MSELLGLAERVERAEGPDRVLDAEIALAAGWTRQQTMAIKAGFPERESWISPDRVNALGATPAYTASLDTAMTLAVEDVSNADVLRHAIERCIRAGFVAGEDFRRNLPRFLAAEWLKARDDRAQALSDLAALDGETMA